MKEDFSDYDYKYEYDYDKPDMLDEETNAEIKMALILIAVFFGTVLSFFSGAVYCLHRLGVL